MEISSDGSFKYDQFAESFSSSDTADILALIKTGHQYVLSNTDSAAAFFKNAYNKSLLTGFIDGVALALINMGQLEIRLGNQEEGYMYMEDAYKYAKNSVYLENVITVWHVNTGIYHVYRSEYDSAIVHFNMALEAISNTTSEFHPHYLAIYNNIAAVNIRMNQPETALYYLEKAERIARGSSMQKELAYTLCNKGHLYTDIGNYDSALYFLKEGLRISEKEQLMEIEQALKSDMGALLIKMGQPKESLKYLEGIMSSQLNFSPLYNVILPGYNLGLAYYQLGDYRKAELQLLKTIDLAKNSGFTDGWTDALKTLSDVYAAKNQPEEALKYYKEYGQVKDSLMGVEKLKSINELEMKYQSVQKDKELADKKLQLSQQAGQIKQQYNWILISSLIAVILVISGLFLYINNKSKNVRLQSELDILKKEQKIQMLRSLIEGEEQERARIGKELHDGIGGLLSAIKLQLGSIRLKHEKVLNREFDTVIHLVDETNKEIRDTAHNLMPEMLLKNGLSATISAYCNRLSTKYSPHIIVQIYGHIPRLNIKYELSIYRIIQEIVNNAVKHSKCEKILVQMNWQERHFHIAVEDDGIGFSKNIISDPLTGIGLKSIIMRVKELDGDIDINTDTSKGSAIYIDFEANRLLLPPSAIKNT